jgi:hypothetical protein
LTYKTPFRILNPHKAASYQYKAKIHEVPVHWGGSFDFFNFDRAIRMFSAKATALLFVLLTSFPVLAKDIVAPDGCVDRARFDQEWQRYSDIDDRIPLESRSWDAQEHQAALDEIREARIEIARLGALMELDRQNRLAVRDYNKALQQGHKVNLLKTFWRMAWITYNTIGGPTGKREFVDAGKDLAELLSSAGLNIPSISRALGIVKELLPKQYSSVPGESGKVVNTGVDAVLEGLKGVEESPEKMVANVVSKIMETAGKEYLPSSELSKAELSDEELNILRREHIELRHLDKALEQSYALNKERAAQIEALKAQIAKAQEKAKDAEKSERRRLLANLDKDCLKKPIKIEISAPTKVRLGESALLSAKVSGGSGEYTLHWYAAKPGVKGPNIDPSAHAEGSRTLQYRPGAAGPHLIILNADDKKLPEITASAGVLIEAVVPGAAVVPPPKPPPPIRTAGGPILLETLTVTGKTKGVYTSFATQPGKTYMLETSGAMQVEDYNYQGKLVLSTKENPVFNSLSCNDLTFASLSNYQPMSFNKKIVPGNGKPIKLHYQFANFPYVKTSGTFTIKVYEIPSDR